jgi:hypothetical protein
MASQLGLSKRRMMGVHKHKHRERERERDTRREMNKTIYNITTRQKQQQNKESSLYR